MKITSYFLLIATIIANLHASAPAPTERRSERRKIYIVLGTSEEARRIASDTTKEIILLPAQSGLKELECRESASSSFVFAAIGKRTYDVFSTNPAATKDVIFYKFHIDPDCEYGSYSIFLVDCSTDAETVENMADLAASFRAVFEAARKR